MSQPPFLPPPVYSVDYGFQPPRQRTNGFAVASLVLGIVGCVPFITALLAVIFGIVGLRKTRDPSVGGLGLAIAGLILGIVGLLGWGAVGSFVGEAYFQSVPARTVSRQFLADVCAGKTSQALTLSSGISAAGINSSTAAFRSFGTYSGVTFTGFNLSDVNGQMQADWNGVAVFSGGPRMCHFRLVKQPGGFKVISYSVQ